ncbi:hypothetical protein MUP05_03530 [Candidatus Bathyarchaeota archaeon]|nr:hypothetical protein [Candidatus Bathyarchaeota archaeon]
MMAQQLETVATAEQLLERVEKALSTTIIGDRESKLISFLAMISTYLKNPFHVAFISDSSTGKSYIALQTAKFFPSDDVITCDHTSPTGLLYSETADISTLDWRSKIIIFKDQPHTKVLEMLQSIMSKDEGTANIRITDRDEKGRLKKRHIKIIGTPTFVFCSSLASLDDQIQTRVFQLSADDSPQKIEQVIALQNRMFTDPQGWLKEIEQDPDMQWLRQHVLDIKQKTPSFVVIPESLKVKERFLGRCKHLIPRTQRDFPRLNCLIQSIALVNLPSRRLETNGPYDILYADESDVEAAIRLYENVLTANELGLAPSQLDLYQKVMVPLWESGIQPSLNEIMQKHFEVYRRQLSRRKWGFSMKPSLLNAGLMVEEKDPLDRRKLVYLQVGPTTEKDETIIHSIQVTTIPESCGSYLQNTLPPVETTPHFEALEPPETPPVETPAFFEPNPEPTKLGVNRKNE